MGAKGFYSMTVVPQSSYTTKSSSYRDGSRILPLQLSPYKKHFQLDLHKFPSNRGTPNSEHTHGGSQKELSMNTSTLSR